MDIYLNNLDQFCNHNLDHSSSCCNHLPNLFISSEFIICRVCGNNVENISSLPEKVYDNKNNSHHGMPVNELLPDTNLGSVVAGSHYKNYNMNW